MGGPVKTILSGALCTVIAIILLTAVVLPQMHTGYLYINNTIGSNEIPGGGSIWGILELLLTIGFGGGGLALIGMGLWGTAKSSGGRGGRRRK